MKRTKILTMIVVAMGLAVCLAQLTWAVPMGTAYTYQGRLIEGDEAGDGLYDLEFKLFDDPCTGTQQGSTVSIDDLDVIDGYFTVELDFGSEFDGNARWLEINVRPGASVGPFVILSPRQEVTPTPYALYAQSAEDANTVDGFHANEFASRTHAHSATSITSGTLSTSRYSAFQDLLTEGYLGNASGDIAQNNGVLQPNLNADRLDGYHANSFMTSVTDYGRYNVSSILYEGTTALANKYLGIGSTATNSDRVDGLHASSFAGASHSHNTLYFTEAESDSRFVNVTGDTMTGRLNMNTTGTGIDIVSNPAAATSYGVHVNADQSAANNYTIYGLYSDTDSSASTAGAFGMYSNVRKETGTGSIYGSYDYAYHNGTGGTAYGTYSRADGSDTGTAYGTYSYAHKPSTDTSGSTYGGYFVSDNDSSGSSWGVYSNAYGTGGTNTAVRAIASNGSYNYGVYASATGGTSWAGYFYGSLGVDIYGTGNNIQSFILDPDGYASNAKFAMYDTDGEMKVQIVARETSTTEGAEMKMYDEDGTNTIEFDAEYASDGGGYLALRNGVGTTTISLDSDYSGDGRITTEELRITGGSDLSEQFDINGAKDAVKPGMLVSIDPKRAGKLIISNASYDKKVAGIISGAGGVKPGMMMGQEGSQANGDHPVALTGRVYCWADASNGAIEPGDLLTTSSTPGHAMKVSNHNKALGAIIGKAMTSLEEGKGLVLVLVSLQ